MNWGIKILQTFALPLGYGAIIPKNLFFVLFFSVIYKNKKAFLGFVFTILMEAPPRFELGNKDFADLRLTTWLWRHLER